MKIGRFFGKKQVILAALVLALGVAVYLNYFFNRDPLLAGEPQTVTGDTTEPSHLGEATYVGGEVSDVPATLPAVKDYFTAARENRTLARGEAVELIRDALADAKLTDEDKKQLIARLDGIAASVDREASTEALIVAQGFEDCIVFIEEGSCTVVVKCPELTAAEALKISEIVTASAGVSATAVKISARM